jgi:hypothetical protein
VDAKYEQIVLCGPHARDYRLAGEEIDLDEDVRVKDSCEICGSLGWTYWIDRDGSISDEVISMRRKMCAHVGCAIAVPFDQRFCQKHADDNKRYQAERQARYDKTVRLVRDADIHAFYLTPEWNTTKQVVRDKFKGLCVWSYFVDGMIIKGEEPHHIKPIRTEWELRLALPNLIYLSHAVHMKVEAAYRKSEKIKKQVQDQLFDLMKRWENEFACPKG